MNQYNLKNRSIFCNDNLEVLQGINSNCIDLIYLDPPFNKKKVFTAPINSSAKGTSFSDIFREEDIKDEWLQTIKEDQDKVYGFLNGIKVIEGKTSYNYCYLAYMAIRLIECQRVLKDTGSLYLHCDPTMSHSLKLLLDCIFGEKNFRNEIVWCYNKWSVASKFFSRNHDIILFYSKDEALSFNVLLQGRAKSTLKRFRNREIKSEIGVSGKRLPSKTGIKKSEGVKMADYWNIPIIAPSANERTGYPTQKPLALLERVIKASSNEGDIILDPFCGCATTCVAAEKLGRQWIGIDVSIKAYELVKERLQKEVTNPENLFDYEKELNFYTEPLKRTDVEEDIREKKWVYVISNKQYEGEYKVGVAKDWKSRLNSYQTSDPNRGYDLEHKVLTQNFRALEKHIHTKFDNKHEWVKGDLNEIQKEMETFITMLFTLKNKKKPKPTSYLKALMNTF